MKSALLSLVLALGLGGCAEDVARGEIQGEVCDAASGAPLAGVTVRVGDESLATDADGHFRALAVPAGMTSVRVDGRAREDLVVAERDIAVVFDPACRASDRDAPPFIALGAPLDHGDGARLARSSGPGSGPRPSSTSASVVAALSP